LGTSTLAKLLLALFFFFLDPLLRVCEEGEIWGCSGWKRGPRNRVEMCIYRGREQDGRERESGGKCSYSRVMAGGEREMEVGLQLTIAVS
jgi:hypothetical protein